MPLKPAGAKVLATNKEAKKPGALLDDDSDTFLKNDCKAEAKWVVLELSQVAKVARLELSQVRGAAGPSRPCCAAMMPFTIPVLNRLCYEACGGSQAALLFACAVL